MERPKRRWDNNISKMDFIEVGWSGIGWVDMAQEGSCKGSGSIKYGGIL
jgi:hypothetical protein